MSITENLKANALANVAGNAGAGQSSEDLADWGASGNLAVLPGRALPASLTRNPCCRR